MEVILGIAFSSQIRSSRVRAVCKAYVKCFDRENSMYNCWEIS